MQISERPSVIMVVESHLALVEHATVEVCLSQ